MDDDLMLLPLETPEVDGYQPAPVPTPGGSSWWPVVTVVAVVVALFSLIRNDGERRPIDPPAVAEPPATAPPSTVSSPATTPPLAEVEAPAPAFDPPLMGRVWNSELVVLDGDVVTFVDLATAEYRTADLPEVVGTPVAFYEETIVFSDGRDLVRVTPGFANRRYVRHDAPAVAPLPGVPLAFHNLASTTQPEIVLVADSMGATTWLDAGARPWAMWNGSVLVSHDRRIEVVALDGSEPVGLAVGDVVAASGDAVLYERCDGDGGPSAGDEVGDNLEPDDDAAGSGVDRPEATDAERPLLPVPADCELLLMRRDGTVSGAVDLPAEVTSVSLSPRGNHVIYTADLDEGSGVSRVFVARADGVGEAVSVTTVDTPSDGVWPEPLWAQDGRAAILSGSDGEKLIDLDSGGALAREQILGDLEGEIVGFVSIRHQAGITSPVEPGSSDS